MGSKKFKAIIVGSATKYRSREILIQVVNLLRLFVKCRLAPDRERSRGRNDWKREKGKRGKKAQSDSRIISICNITRSRGGGGGESPISWLVNSLQPSTTNVRRHSRLQLGKFQTLDPGNLKDLNIWKLENFNIFFDQINTSHSFRSRCRKEENSPNRSRLGC